VYEYPGGYYSARPLLKRMVEDGDIICHDPPKNTNFPNVYSLSNARLKRGMSLYGHDMDAADYFVAFKRTGELERWETGFEDPEMERYVAGICDIIPDKVFQVKACSQMLCLEVDRGSEKPQLQIQDKLDNYLKLSRALGYKEPFTVLFTTQGYRYKNSTEQTRHDQLLPVLKAMKRGQQFLVGLHTDVLADPLGKVWTDPTSGLKLALGELDGLWKARS